LRTGQYFSNGKLLLSGEYLVLHGAKALAVPLKYGQRMLVQEIPESAMIYWDAFVKNEPWFSATFSLNHPETLHCTDAAGGHFVELLLQAGARLQPDLLTCRKGFRLQHYIDFDINWGWGSSSSLISNMAHWLDVDLFTLYKSLFNGSGYDVFTARAHTPSVYELKANGPVMQPVNMNPELTPSLYFVYLGNKQDSQKSVEKFRNMNLSDLNLIDWVSQITEAMTGAASPGEFMGLMRLHEALLSELLEIPPVKEERFPGFDGEIKSLGAWGGDFIMACSGSGNEYVKRYFQSKGLTTVFSWPEIVLS
jgi:mevalonate kinase